MANGTQERRLREVLDPLAIPDAVKADAYDAFFAAQDEQDFQRRFDRLALPQETKGNLWDLRFAPARVAATSTPQAGPPTPPQETKRREPSLAFQAKFGIPTGPPTREESERHQALGEKVKAAARTPLIPIGQLVESQVAKMEDDPSRWALNTVVDLGRLTARTVEGLSTPENVALIGSLFAAPHVGVPALVTRLVAGGFSLIMANQSADEIVAGYEAARRGDLREAGQRFGSSIVSATFAELAGHGGAFPKEGVFRGAWRKYNEEYPPSTKAELESRLRTERADEPPPATLRTEEVKPSTPPPQAPVIPVPPSQREAEKPPVRVGAPPTPPEAPSVVGRHYSEVFQEQPGHLFRGMSESELSKTIESGEMQPSLGIVQMPGGWPLADATPRLEEAFRYSQSPIVPSLRPGTLRKEGGAIAEFVNIGSEYNPRWKLVRGERVGLDGKILPRGAGATASTEAQRGSLRIQGELPDNITVVPRATDLGPLAQFFVSPSQAFGKIHPAAGRIAELTIEAGERIAHSTKVALDEVHSIWRPLKKAEASAVIPLLEDATVTPENLSIKTPSRIRDAYIRTRTFLDEQLRRINDAREKAGKERITGILTGYWPHVFQGDWAILKRVGNAWTPIDAPKVGWLAESQVEAIAKAREYWRANPGVRLKVELRRMYLTPEEATILPRGSYFRLMNRLSKLTATEIDPATGEIRIGPAGRAVAFEQLKGVARPAGRKPGPARFGHVMERESDLAGWLEDPKALELLVRGAERHIEMVKLRPGVAKLRERVLREAPEAERLHGQLDSYIEAAVEGRPDKFTRAINDAWVRLGERFGVATRPQGFQRFSRRVNEAQSLLKLGFSPVTALVNLSQTALNTYPVLGAKWTVRGMRLYTEAYRDHIIGRPNKYWDVIEELGIPEQISKAEEASFRDLVAGRFPRTAGEIVAEPGGLLVELGLWPFRGAEQANRGVAALGRYAEATEARGLAHADAVGEARSTVTRTQFVYGSTDAPAVLRQAWTRVPGQFKTFWLKEVEFILGLNKTEAPRFIAAMTLTGGALGLPAIGLLNEMVKITSSAVTGKEYDALAEAQMWARQQGPAVRGLLMGAPTAAGVDILRNIGFQEFLSPQMLGTRSLLGPTGSDVGNFITYAQAPEGREKTQARNRLIAGLSPEARRLWQVLARKKQLVDPRTGQTIVDDLTDKEKLGVILGFTPIRIAQDQAIDRALRREIVHDASLRGGVADKIAQLWMAQEQATESNDDAAYGRYANEEDRWWGIAETEGVEDDLLAHVRRRFRELSTPRTTRTGERAPERLEERLEKYEMRRLSPPTPPPPAPPF